MPPVSAARAEKSPALISASRARTTGSSNASIAAALSLLMMSIGVRLGAQSEYHTDAYKPGNPASSTVGISGAEVDAALVH